MGLEFIDKDIQTDAEKLESMEIEIHTCENKLEIIDTKTQTESFDSKTLIEKRFL